MARFMRSIGQSRLRPPAAIGPPVTFRPVKVTLTDQRSTRLRARAVHSRISPPTVVTPISVVTVVFDPVTVQLASQRHAQAAARTVRSRLQPPTVVGPGGVARPIAVKLADQRPLRNLLRAHSRLQPPAVISQTVLPKPLVHLADQRGIRAEARAAHSRLRPPAVTGTNQPFRAAAVKLTDQRGIRSEKRAARSTLRGPTLPAPAAAPVFIPYSTSLADQRCIRLRARSARSKLRPPAVVMLNAPFRPLQVCHVRIRPPRVHPHVAPPAITSVTGLSFDAGTTGVIAPDGEGREGRVRTGTLAASRRGRIDQDGTGRLDKPHEGTLE